MALQALYETDMAGHAAAAAFGWLKIEGGLPEASSTYAMRLIDGVTEQRAEIDKLIHKHAPAWPVKQLSVVDRNILRLALFEIRLGGEIPRKVAINEAVELAKAFGSDSSPRFVNGVLGSVMEELEGDEEGSSELPLVSANNTSEKGK